MRKQMLNLGTSVGLMMAAALAHADQFALTSKDIAPGGTISAEQVFNGFGCSGANKSPELSWVHAPAGTKSFALLVHDPDAPTGGAGWWHWGIVNIPATATGLTSGAGTEDGKALPAGSLQLITDFGKPGWGGPCPPQGDKPHHYNFTLYALKVEKLDVPADAKMALAGFMVNANAIGKATLVGRFGR
ncbi:MAG TPA: YbhB/YbcL family Raf kinase inhibitor-like protein [Pseudomonadales bacterium]|nr:YbhB/YbcL family Raf kinase inhibitor-like protein [Pseudomonadales bacterium]